MNESLHPLTLAEILDRTAHIYRTRFLVFFGIGALSAGTVFACAAGTFAFMAWMGARTKHGVTVPDAAVWVFLIALLALVVPVCLAANALGEAAMSDAAARSFLGENITIRGAYKTTWRRAWRYVGLYTLQMLVIVVAPLACIRDCYFWHDRCQSERCRCKRQEPRLWRPALSTHPDRRHLCCMDAAAAVPGISGKRCRANSQRGLR